MKIQTFDAAGKPNGYLIPIWNFTEDDYRLPEQVYLTVVAPHSIKGPHLHKKRRGLFCCIRGNIRIRKKTKFGYRELHSGEDNDYRLIHVNPGEPAAICNDGDEEALVINMPSPAWSADDPDEWPVEDWNWK
jgi:dTDP-4-dehydrorhamnose 3,5-epimerase-like enzyme